MVPAVRDPRLVRVGPAQKAEPAAALPAGWCLGVELCRALLSPKRSLGPY